MLPAVIVPQPPADTLSAMIRDLRIILDGWEYEPGKISVRKIIGRDSREKVQTRIDMGVLQIELDGRPDGQRSRGHESLLDFFEHQAGQHAELCGGDDDFALAPEDCAELRHEAYLYYQRYLSLFVLEDFERVIRDTARNLRLIDFCGKFAGVPDDRQALESQRAYVLMMNARAKACQALQQGHYEKGLAAVDAGVSSIRALAADDDHDADEAHTELRVLLRLRREIVQKMPPEAPSKLRCELEAALASEDYEKAAQLRDRLAQHNCKSCQP